MVRGWGTFELTKARRSAGAAVLSLWVASCAQTQLTEDRAFDRGEATSLFGAGYAMIQDKYIEPVSASEIALAGLQGLHALDSGISIERDASKVVIDLPNSRDIELLAPPDDNVSGWANLTSLAVSLARSESAAIAEQNTEELYQTVFKSALGKLDHYSRYTTAASARNARASRDGYGGIGIRLRHASPGEVYVDSVMPDTPAARADLRAGDRIMVIDGIPTQNLDERQIVERLRGRVNSEVRLSIARKNADYFDVDVSRALIFTPTVEFRAQGGAAIIKLSAFNQSTSRNLTRAIERARRDMGDDLKGIVLDMRDNPGGLLDQAVSVSDLFLASGRIVSTRGRHPDSMQAYDATGRDITNGLPLVVLVNGQSASAAEIVAAALQDRGRAVVVGSNSFGKGTVQNISRLPNDGEMVLTWSRFHAPSGYAIASLGVLPNVCTSGDNADAETVINRINPNWAHVSLLMSAWRFTTQRDEPQLASLRDNCPRNKGLPETDLVVAERLIDNPALYRRALQQDGATMAEPGDIDMPSRGGSAAIVVTPESLR